MIIRRGSLKDLDELAKLLHEYDVYENNLDRNVKIDSLKKIKEDVRNQLKKKIILYTIIEENKEVLGLINWRVAKINDKKTGMIQNIIINQKARERGFGNLLVKEVMKDFKRSNCKNMTGFVRLKNKKALEFWKKQGFKFEEGFQISKTL